MEMEDYDEPYHYSPAYGSDDIILEGSDADELPEETIAKRARYEKQAKRCGNGHMPMIMSASMKGPFDRASGWQNPWRYRPPNSPKSKAKDDWWNPGSEDMMFTRKNVLKRAADHGLGWMTPAAALEWCKAAASAEAEAIGGGEEDSMEAYIDSENDSPSGVFTEDILSAIVTEQPRQVKAPVESGPSTARTGRITNSFTKARKRPHDSEWLKGSFTFKRARWDAGPPVPSPTPLPDMHRKSITLKSTRSTDFQPLVPRGASSVSQRSLSAQSQNPDLEKRNRTKSVGYSDKKARDALMLAGIGGQNKEPPSTRSQRLPTLHNGEYKQVEIEDPQDTISAMSFCYGSTIKSDPPGTASNAIDLISSDSEADSNLQRSENVALHEQQSEISFFAQSSKPDVGSISHKATHNPIAEEGLKSFITEVVPSCRDLEKFEFRKKKRMYEQTADESRLVSSSLKSKAKSTSLETEHLMIGESGTPYQVEQTEDFDEVWETTIGANDHVDINEQSHLGVSKSSRKKRHSCLHQASLNSLDDLDDDDGDDEWETTIGENCHFNSVKATRTMQMDTPSIGKVLHHEILFSKSTVRDLEESTTAPRSGLSNSSWDMMEDLSNSSFRQVIATSPNKSLSPKPPPVEIQTRTNTTSPVLYDNGLATSKRVTPLKQSPLPSTKSPHRSPRKQLSQKQLVVESSPLKPTPSNDLKADATIDQNDISTQSANTTPSRSLKVVGSPDSRMTTLNNMKPVVVSDVIVVLEEKPDERTPHEQASSHIEGQTEDSDQDEMSQIQMALSQNCPSTSSQGSESSSWGHASKDFVPQAEQIDMNRSITALPKPQSSDESVRDGSPRIIRNETTPICSKAAPTPSRTATPRRLFVPPQVAQDDTVIETRDNLTVTPGARDEPGWRPSEPQTPWAEDDVLPRNVPTIIATPMQNEVATLYNKDEEPIETNWEEFELSLLAQNEYVAPLKAFITPVQPRKKRVIEATRTSISEEDITTMNPWTSSLKKTGSKKSKKRVSFGFALAEEQGESTQHQSSILQPPAREDSLSQLDPLDDGNQPSRPISILNTSLATQRSFKRILPDKTASQLNSSPAPIEAMAEAFIMADREAPRKRDISSPVKAKTQSLRLDGGSPWRCEDSIYHDHTDTLHETTPAMDFMANFDIADALGEANAFLEDWSVEADLKRSRESDVKDHESNGMKRRKLFGIV